MRSYNWLKVICIYIIVLRVIGSQCSVCLSGRCRMENNIKICVVVNLVLDCGYYYCVNSGEIRLSYLGKRCRGTKLYFTSIVDTSINRYKQDWHSPVYSGRLSTFTEIHSRCTPRFIDGLLGVTGILCWNL